MIEIENPDCCQLLMRLPADRSKGFDNHGVFYRPSATAAYVLGNFRFVTDDISGLRLHSFTREGATWTNREFELWRAIVFDTTLNVTGATSMFHPVAEKLTSVVVTGHSLVATWSNMKVGGLDALNATLTLTLADSTDWLNASLSVEWVGTPTRYAIDSLCVLPLRIAPRNRGTDFAVVPTVFGILSEDPIRHLRYDPSIGGTQGLFRGKFRNVGWWPSGRDWSTGIFAYYETTEAQGFMVWNERWDLTLFTVCWQSDGENMVFEPYVPQPDNVLVGNNGRTLEATDFCLRAYQITNAHGWWDAGVFYKQRLIEKQPSWFQEIRTRRDDLSTYEKGPFVHLDLALSSWTGSTSYLDTLIGQMKTGLGITDSTPVFAIGDIHNCNLIEPYEAEIGDARATLITLFGKNVFAGKWEPSNPDGAGGASLGFGPRIWSKFIWSGDNKRWWSNLDMTGVLRGSRSGYLAGGGNDRLQQFDKAPMYYRERAYTVTNWDAGTKTATVSGTPSADGFPATPLRANVLPQGGGAMGQAAVTSLGANTIVVTTLFTDGQGATVTPANGDTIEVMTSEPGVIGCPHAMANSTALLSNMEANGMNGKFAVHRTCSTYVDTYDEPNHVTPVEFLETCYRDHSSWSKIDAGYVRHPYGGGNWWATSKRQFFKALKDSVHSLQQATVGLKAYLMHCEDTSEVTNDIFDISWHTISSGQLWRSTAGIDPAIDKYKAIPLFATIHAGRVFCRATAQEFSTAALVNAAPYNDPELHKTMAYWLGIEWCYGQTLPMLSLFAHDTYGAAALNLWDDTLYVSGGGAIANEVKQIRDLWVQINHAELNWIQEYLRYGDFMPPGEVDFENTDWTIGRANTTYTTTYYSYDILYDRARYPNVVHAVWRSQMDGSILVILTNWTSSVSSWAATLATEAFRSSQHPTTFSAAVLDYTGAQDGDTLLDFNPDTGAVLVQDIPAYSIKAVLLMPIVDMSNLPLIATWRPGVQRVGQVQEGM